MGIVATTAEKITAAARNEMETISYFQFNDGDKKVDENLSKTELLQVIDFLSEEIKRQEERRLRDIRMEKLFSMVRQK